MSDPKTAGDVVIPVITKWLLSLGVGTAAVAIIGTVLGFEGVLGSIARFVFGGVVKVVPLGRKKYAALSTARDLNAFLGEQVYPYVSELNKARVDVQWVSSAEEACSVEEREEGELIVRLRHETVPTYNQILGLMACVHHIFFPHAWPHFSESFRSAIQLHFAGSLASYLGGPAERFFSTQLLQPAIAKHPQTAITLDRLRSIEKAGLFEAVFLQEMVELSDGLIRVANPVIAQECEEFVEWLDQFASREEGEDGQLQFFRARTKLALLLAAKQETAARGTAPYETRMRRNIFEGARNVYLIGLTRAHHDFSERILLAVKEMPWVKFIKSSRPAKTTDGPPDQLFVAQFRRNDQFLKNRTFKALVEDAGVVVGTPVECVVRDLSATRAVVRHDYVDITVFQNELAWGFAGNAKALLEEGFVAPIVPLSVNEGRNSVLGSFKRALADEAAIASLLIVGTEYRVEVVDVAPGLAVHVRLLLEPEPPAPLYGKIEWLNWSHFAPGSVGWSEPTLGEERVAKLVSVLLRDNVVELSATALSPADWAIAMRAYPKGREIAATVHSVDPDGVICNVGPNIRGRISADRMRQAGHELADFQRTVVAGQVFNVVVVGAKTERQFLQLDLARNRTGGSTPPR